MNQITIGDIIGYSLTFVVGVVSGVLGNKLVINNKKSIHQNRNVVLNGDITGGNKNDKED